MADRVRCLYTRGSDGVYQLADFETRGRCQVRRTPGRLAGLSTHKRTWHKTDQDRFAQCVDETHLSPLAPDILLRRPEMLTDALVVEKPGSPFRPQKISVEDDPREDEVMIEMRANRFVPYGPQLLKRT